MIVPGCVSSVAPAKMPPHLICPSVATVVGFVITVTMLGNVMYETPRQPD